MIRAPFPIDETPPLFPWQLQPDRLWSLWDMLRPYASAFVWLSQVVSDIGQLDRREPTRDSAHERLRRGKSGPLQLLVKANLAILPEWAKHLPLKSTMFQHKELMEKIQNGCDAGELFDPVRELGKRFYQDLQGELFYYVDGRLVPYYQDKQAFGPDVADKFPSALDDIQNAGECIALGQGTASVFHLMRVMEVGLRALSKSLGIPYAPSWESHLTQMRVKVEAKHASKTANEKKDTPFYRDVLGVLTAVKIAWRNQTMHIVKRYSVEEAQEVYASVRTFMQHLSKALAEVPGETISTGQSVAA